MRIDTTRMSTKIPPADRRAPRSSSPPRFIVCHRSRSRSSPPSRLLSATRTTCTISATRVHADDVRAAEHGGGDGGGRAPVALRRRPVADAPRAGTTCATARRAPAGRARGDLGQAAPAHHSCARPFGKPEPGVDDERARGARRPRRAGHARSSSRADIRRPRRRSPPRAYIVVGTPARVHQDQRRAAAGDHRRRAPDRTARPLTSLTIVAPASSAARGDVGLVGVDGDRNARAGRASAVEDRQHAGALLVGRHRRGARAASIRRRRRSGRRRRPPWRSAASTAARRIRAAPPSANESGVTLRMPMTSERSPRRAGRGLGAGR